MAKSEHVHVSSKSGWRRKSMAHVQVSSFSNSSLSLIGVEPHRNKPGPKSGFGMNSRLEYKKNQT